MPKLLIKSGEREGFIFQLTDKKVSIGRDLSNTIALPDRRVSRFHAAIDPRGSECVIEDLNSVNGTLINDTPVQKKSLKLGDEIIIGSTIVAFLSSNLTDEGLSKDSAVKSAIRIVSKDETSTGLTVECRVSPDKVDSIIGESHAPDVKALPKSYERLVTLYRVSGELSSVVDLTQLLDRILEVVLDILQADRGFIMLTDNGAKELILKAAHKREGIREGEEITISKTIAHQVLDSGESILSSDARHDARFQEVQSIVIHDICSTMCVPLKLKEKILGVMYVDTKGKVIRYTKDDLELLTSIGNQAAIAIDNAQLIEDLKRANAEIKTQHTQLIEAEKLSALGQLAGGVAHEINNPMTCILGYSELTLKQLQKGQLDQEDLKTCAEQVKIINDEGHRCEQIVQTLLQFARRKKDDTTAISVNLAVESALKIAKFHIKKVTINIETNLSDPLPEIQGDVNQLQQVFLNFIINARDAMEKGGTLKIASRQAGDRWIEVSFQDSGCGIPEEKIEQIFKPLFTTKEEGKGTGLGLSISQDIIDRHQGAIDVQSVVGQGTTFIVKLPVLK